MSKTTNRRVSKTNKDSFCSQCGHELSKKLKNNIAIVLDSSGSMGRIRDNAIDFFNEQISTLRAEASDMENKVTLVTFDSKVNDPVYDGAHLDSVKDITRKDYEPSGWTALYDALGTTIERLSKSDKNKKEDAFLVIAITDGMENWSKEHTAESLKKLIQEKEARGNWTFTFLGANQDVVLTQNALGLSVNNVRSFESTKKGMRDVTEHTNIGTMNYMAARKSGALSVDNFYAGEDKNEDPKEEKK